MIAHRPTSHLDMNMKASALLIPLGLASCGGDVAEGPPRNGSESGSLPADGGPSGSRSGTGSTSMTASGSGAGTTRGSETGTRSGSTGVMGSGSGTSSDGGQHLDAAATCTLPPYSTPSYGGQCAFCNNEWYCPFPRFPVTDCPPGVHMLYDSCTVACVQCSDGSASYFPCSDAQYTDVNFNAFACSM